MLQRDSSPTLFELGQEIGLSTSAVQRRIGRYRRHGLIDREVTVLNPAAFAEVLLALVMITLERESTSLHGELVARLTESPAVQQCYDLAGEYDYAVLMAAQGTEALRLVVEELFMDAPNIRRYDTFVVYRVVKSGLEIPLS